jgi:hypothetical protein
MNQENFAKLPPEMQQRIASIVSQATAAGEPPQPPANPVPPQVPPQAQPQGAPQPASSELANRAVRPPSLMDHVIALRQEVAELRAQGNAIGQVTEAVGNAVGEMYSMFQTQTSVTNHSAGSGQTGAMNDDY